MDNRITRRTMMTMVASIVCAPAFPEDRASGELKTELGIWVLDSVQAGMQNEQLIGAIRNKTKELLAKAGIKLPDLTPEVIEVEEEYWEKGRRDASERKGPPPWAPAHGWRRKFGDEQEAAFGDYIVTRVREGRSAPELLTSIRTQIEQVSKGGKVGDLPEEAENDNKPDRNPKSVNGRKGGPPKEKGKYDR